MPKSWRAIPRYSIWNVYFPRLTISCGSCRLFVFLPLLKLHISDADNLGSGYEYLPPFFGINGGEFFYNRATDRRKGWLWRTQRWICSRSGGTAATAVGDAGKIPVQDQVLFRHRHCLCWLFLIQWWRQILLATACHYVILWFCSQLRKEMAMPQKIGGG